MRTWFVLAAALLIAVGCFALAPGPSQVALVADQDAAQLCAGGSIPQGTCGYTNGGTQYKWCQPGCASDQWMTPSSEYKGYGTTPCYASGGCGYNKPTSTVKCSS